MDLEEKCQTSMWLKRRTIRDTKRVALDEGTTFYAIVELALNEFHERRRKRGAKPATHRATA